MTSTGKTVKILHITDEFTRESLSDLVAYSIDADTTVAELDRIVDQRGCRPTSIRMDNGPELTAHALRDWCRFTGAGTSYIDPGSPWQNPWVESYGSRMRDELLAIEQFDSLLEAQSLSPTGKRSTTPTVPTRRSACSRRSSSLGGGPPTSYSSRSGWTDQWGPVTVPQRLRFPSESLANPDGKRAWSPWEYAELAGVAKRL